MSSFVGRKPELSELKEFSNRTTAGLAVVCGRRRIGKSTLIEYFAKDIVKGRRFVELYGLAPREGIDNADQLRHFGELLGASFNLPAMHFAHWNEAFDTLASLTQKGGFVILLDEISWIAGSDEDFAGKLKGAWDTKFKKNPKLLLFLCGSVTSWIRDNILNDKGYVGRISLTLTLEELPLCDANEFFAKNELMSAHEKFKLLCVTGGVPRYLEEINPKLSAEENIKKLLYRKEAFLFLEFDKIFKDIFGKRAEDYKKIVKVLVASPLEPKQIAEKLGVSVTGAFSKRLDVLMTAGFIRRDFVWNLNGKETSISRYRLSDNYIRYYLKYVEPQKSKIEKDLFDEIHLDNLREWMTIMGLQFENLVHNNIKWVIKKLNIPFESIISVSPYFQNKTTKQESCQIDLLIHTKFTLYVCEIKFRRKIASTVIKEVLEKIQKLRYPKTLSVRPVLIYQGELAPQIQKDNFFSNLIAFEELLSQTSD